MMAWKEISVKNFRGYSCLFEFYDLFTNEDHFILMREIPGRSTTSLTNMTELVVDHILEYHFTDMAGMPARFIQYTNFPGEQTLDWVEVERPPAGNPKPRWTRLSREERMVVINGLKQYGDEPYLQGDPLYSPVDDDWIDRMIEREG